jgi:hypothetical protein
MPRFLFVAPTVKEPEPPGGYLAEGNGPLESWLVVTLGKLAAMPRRQVGFGPSRKLIVEWTTERSTSAEMGTGQEELMGLYSRLGHHLAKLCALLCVSDDGIADQYQVTDYTAERAVALLEWILSGTARVFEERVVFSKFEIAAQKALRQISGSIERGVLLKKMRMPASELDRLLMTLKERGEIDEYIEQSGGRPRRMIVRTLPAGDREERGTNREESREERANGQVVHLPERIATGK